MQNLTQKMKQIGNSLFIREKNVDDFWLEFWDLSGAKVCKSCRSRQELSNEYLLAKIGGLLDLACLLACLRRYSRERASQSLEENSIHDSFASLGARRPRPRSSSGSAAGHPCAENRCWRARGCIFRRESAFFDLRVHLSLWEYIYFFSCKNSFLLC